jgi:response regulator RpfG family c-di-GMP phosphodiesterase
MMTAIFTGVYMETRRKAILCLCHDNNMLQVRRMLLERFGYSVLTSSSVEQAAKAAEKHCPDMLLMDDSLPGLDFEQVGRQVKKLCPQMMIVVLSPYYYGTGRTSPGTVDRFIARDQGPNIVISEIEDMFDRQTSPDNSNSLPM